MSVFFIAGVHGVGKTTACVEVAKTLNFGHYAASTIIREAKAPAVSEKTKIVADLTANQNLLIAGVSRLVKGGQRLFLDGHFTLRTSVGIEPIPVKFFKCLKIRGIVLYYDAPEKIAARLAKRDSFSPTVEVVRSHQCQEIDHAKTVSNSLSVPLVLLKAFDSKGLELIVREWL